MASKTLITLKTCDNIIFKLEQSTIKHMKTIQTLINSATETTTIPLQTVTSNHLTTIINYIRLSDDGKLNEFSVDELDNDELKCFLMAVHYLSIESLFEFVSQEIADRIQNKSVSYMRKFLGVENDYSPEEEAEVRREYAWAFVGDDVEPDE